MKITQPVNVIIEHLPNYEVLNPLLENDIKDAGDITGGRSAAKCYRTRWDMHEVYPSFKKLTDGVLEVVKRACGPLQMNRATPKTIFYEHMILGD